MTKPAHTCGPGCQHVRVEAPAGWDELRIAQAVVGGHTLLKAESAPFDVWYRDRPMRELSAAFIEAYRAVLRRMIEAIEAYVERSILQGPLHKAVRLPVLITPEQLAEIQKIIGDHHAAFVIGGLDPSAVSPAELQRLTDAGLVGGDLAHVFADAGGAVRSAWEYGHQLGMVEHPREKRPIEVLSYQEWRAGRPQPPLSPAENASVVYADTKAAQAVRGLGNRVAEDFSTIAIEADAQLRREVEETIREAVASNVELREPWRKVVTALGDEVDDWARDLGRIAATEKHDAIQQGQAQAMKRKRGRASGDVRVAKQPNPDACKHCLRLFTEGGAPKIFWLSELEKNGTNVGKKAADWLPTVGPVHPWCACELIEVPEGWAFDEEGSLVPESLKRSMMLPSALAKSAASLARRPMIYGAAGGDGSVTVRVGDPAVRAACEAVIARTPPVIFTRAAGVTMITTDHPRETNLLDDGDLAYWTGNEIRIVQAIDPARVKRVLEHEIGHSLNSWLLTKFGTLDKVREWHTKLWEISRDEGFVSTYAQREPIENAAEVSRLFIYQRDRLLRSYPRQFALCLRAYGDLLKRPKRCS